MIETPPSLTGEARYSDQDLEPLRAALLALSKGDFGQQPRTVKDDRAKSIASGASEYVTKPVDISHLIGLMRGWLERRPRQAGPPRTHPRTEGSG